MGYNAYICNHLSIDNTGKVFKYAAAQSLEKEGKCILDTRSGLAMVTTPEGYTYNMQLYYNYVKSLRKIAAMEKADTVLALAHMGFLPILCEPSFTQGVYASYLLPILEKSGLPLYRRKPMSFCSRPSDMAGVDVWVHKQDCIDILKMSGRAEHVTVQSVYEKLGVTNLVNDVRDLCASNGGTPI